MRRTRKRAVATTLLVLGVLGAAPGADAQTVAGIVRDRATGAVLIGRTVALRSAAPADSVVARATTDSLGVFYLQAPGPGSYGLRFVLGARQVVDYGSLVVADSAAFDQREYQLDVPEPVYYEFDVQKPASPTNHPSPTYPAALQQRGIGGSFAVEFVVDTLGHAVPETFRVLQPAEPLFVEAVRAVLPRLRYLPAEREGRKVRQLVHQAFAFAIGR